MGRIRWKPDDVIKTYLEACLHEVTLNGLQGSSLKTTSWKIVAEKLKNEHNFIVDRKQMRNQYDYLKSKFAAWSKLKNKTGNVYNPVTNTFNLSEEEWQIEIKSNKFIECLRSTPLLYPELCVQLFEGYTSNGFDSWGSSSKLPHPSQEVSDHDLNGLEDLEDLGCTQTEPPTQDVSEDSSARSKGKRKVKETFNSKLMEVGDHITKVAKMLIEKHKEEKLRKHLIRRRRALTKEEKFNHAHAQLRNVIERAYGVLKARFPILKQMAPFSFPIQRDIVIACFAVHNFIRKCNIHDQLFMDYDENTIFSEMQGGESDGEFIHDIEWGSQGIEFMTTLRNGIATQLMSN